MSLKKSNNNKNKKSEKSRGTSNYQLNWEIQKQVLDIFMSVCVREQYLQYTVYKCPVSSADMSTGPPGVEIQSYTAGFVYVYVCVCLPLGV